MITRTFTADHLNEAANHPDVRPYVGPGTDAAGPLDLTPLVQNMANVALEAEGGGWLLINLLPGVYELHTMFTPEGRGKPYFRAAKEALRFMFVETDALEIVTKCPDDNPAARMAASLMGFHERFHRDHAWNIGTPAECGVSFQVFSLDDWIARDPVIADVGHDFHVDLENTKALRGSELPDHPEDEAHDRIVGAAYLMAKHGQMNKAVGVYNRWAPFAGYEPIRMLSPTILDIADAILEVENGQMRILGVR